MHISNTDQHFLDYSYHWQGVEGDVCDWSVVYTLKTPTIRNKKESRVKKKFTWKYIKKRNKRVCIPNLPISQHSLISEPSKEMQRLKTSVIIIRLEVSRVSFVFPTNTIWFRRDGGLFSIRCVTESGRHRIFTYLAREFLRD